MRNYDWKEIKRVEHTTRLVMGTVWPDETILEKAAGAGVYRITYHLCNGVPSGARRFWTRHEAEEAMPS